jgi:hypothetical protein
MSICPMLDCQYIDHVHVHVMSQMKPIQVGQTLLYYYYYMIIRFWSISSTYILFVSTRRGAMAQQ